jgi:DNA-binding MarR family transcriptional regulator
MEMGRKSGSEIEAQRMRAWQGFLHSHAVLVRRLEEELLAERRLPLSWYDALLTLRQAPQRRLRLQDLARSVVLSQSRISRLVASMERAGFVRREPSPGDGRGAYAVLTDRGRQSLREAAPTHLRGIEEHFARHLSHREASAMASAFEKMLAALETEASVA